MTFTSMGIEKREKSHPWYIPAYESFGFHNVSIMQLVQTGVLSDPVDGIWQVCHNRLPTTADRSIQKYLLNPNDRRMG